MQTIELSEDARALLYRLVVEGKIPVDDTTREYYREIARTGILIPVSSFVGGDESFYRFTEAGWEYAKLTWPEEVRVQEEKSAAALKELLAMHPHGTQFGIRHTRERSPRLSRPVTEHDARSLNDYHFFLPVS